MKQMKFSIPDDLRERLRILAVRDERSESAVIRQALRSYLKQRERRTT